MGSRGFRLREWLVQPNLNRLTLGDRTVPLRARLMDVLAYLADHHGEVVSKDEIIAAVWAKQYMAESVLSRSIADLRRILGDDAGNPTFIETITKRGYRLIAPVEPLGASSGPSRAAARPSHSREPSPAAAHTCSLWFGEQEIPLEEGENVIGRTSEAGVRIRSLQVSRRHATIVVTGGRAVLEDLGSKNGTYVRGRRVGSPVTLFDGEEIYFGRELVVFRFCCPSGTTVTGEPP